MVLLVVVEPFQPFPLAGGLVLEQGGRGDQLKAVDALEGAHLLVVTRLLPPEEFFAAEV